MITTAKPPTKIPVSGMCKANINPPKPDSLKAQRVISLVMILLLLIVVFSRAGILCKMEKDIIFTKTCKNNALMTKNMCLT